MSYTQRLIDKLRQRKQIILVALLFPPLIYLALFFYVPMCTGFLYSFGMIDRFYRFTGSFTVSHYIRAFDYTFLLIFSRSLLIAGLTAVLCLFLGYPVAYTIALKMRRFRNLLMILVIIPYWVSFLLRIYALINVLQLFDIYIFSGLKISIMGSFLGVMIGMVWDYLPFMILPLYASIEKLDVSILEASKTLGAGPLKTFFHVTLPLTAPGVAAGTILVFVPSVGEFLIPYFLGGATEYLVGNLIWELILKAHNYWLGSAFSTIVLIIVLVIVLIYMKYGGGEMAF